MKNRYYVTIEVDAQPAYDAGQVAAAMGLAMSDYEGTQELALVEITVRKDEDE